MSAARRERTRRAPPALDPERRGRLDDATSDLSLLLGREYPPEAAARLVAARYKLRRVERRAMSLVAAGDGVAAARRVRALDRIDGEELWVDAHDLLFTVSAALRGEAVLACRDGARRPLGPLPASFRARGETATAMKLVASALAGAAKLSCGVTRSLQNHDRLGRIFASALTERGLASEIQIVMSLAEAASGRVVASSRPGLIDASARWVDVAARAIERI